MFTSDKFLKIADKVKMRRMSQLFRKRLKTKVVFLSVAFANSASESVAAYVEATAACS